ncbi:MULTISPECIES: AcvB/VirJ family lysyl-phosphatidylglycerol hydrolase [Sphingomonas]|jgi:type IV secretory pathway VirJ component|uniref:AcvB/VirJ family lysyl-phosphatidylglycerol hydrolase n=1 Tax=Sphingomonas TaxID=13687 RepID=UPI001AEDC7D5|nr:MULTISPECIES: AcvB/VirJ family lysyl-phosphatidylglycerol hydrolase [Sphingomonas]
MSSPSAPPRRLRRRVVAVGGIAATIACGMAGLWTAAGFFAGEATRLYPAHAPALPIAAVVFSGDLGLRFGMAAETTEGLAAQGVTVLGINTPTLFGRWRSAATVDRIVADGVRAGLARTGAERLVLIGQSFGADILQTGLIALPADLRARVAGVVLVVPGETIFFRADPSGIAYLGKPASRAADTVNESDWAPLTCIYGIEEGDSACPLVHRREARVIAMPGGHFLKNDHSALVAHEMDAVRRALPAPAGAVR